VLSPAVSDRVSGSRSGDGSCAAGDRANDRRAIIYKSSYDKAESDQRLGWPGGSLRCGLAILSDVREATGMPVLTDVSIRRAVRAGTQPWMCCDPGFLCRQPDLLAAAGETGGRSTSK